MKALEGTFNQERALVANFTLSEIVTSSRIFVWTLMWTVAWTGGNYKLQNSRQMFWGSRVQVNNDQRPSAMLLVSPWQTGPSATLASFCFGAQIFFQFIKFLQLGWIWIFLNIGPFRRIAIADRSENFKNVPGFSNLRVFTIIFVSCKVYVGWSSQKLCVWVSEVEYLRPSVSPAYCSPVKWGEI